MVVLVAAAVTAVAVVVLVAAAVTAVAAIVLVAAVVGPAALERLVAAIVEAVVVSIRAAVAIRRLLHRRKGKNKCLFSNQNELSIGECIVDTDVVRRPAARRSTSVTSHWSRWNRAG